MCRYLKKIGNKNRGAVLLYLLVGISVAFLTNCKAGYFQKVVDGLSRGELSAKGLVLYGGILIGGYLCGYLEEYPSRKLEQGLYLDIKLLALEKISRISYPEYQNQGTGRLTQRIENGAQAGRDVLFGFWLRLLSDLVPNILFSLFFIYRISRPVTCVILAGYVLVFVVTNLLLKALYRIKEKILANQEQMNHFLVRGFMEMVVFRVERKFRGEIRRAEKARNAVVAGQVKMGMIHEAFFTIFALMVAMLELGILFLAWRGGGISVGSVVALISLIGNAYTPIAIFNVLFVQYRLDQAAFARFAGFMDAGEDEQLENGKYLEGLAGGLCISGLSFSYGDRKLLRGLELSVKPGEKVAFVGESGSGKSTLVKLLAGLLKYEEGSILVDGVELKEICLDSLYEQMGCIFQEAPVFDGTLRENLVFDREVPEEEMLAALEKAELLELYGKMEKGFDTQLGERGMKISGGEKQRLALARLFLEKKAVLLMDEATSAMDNLTEEKVMGRFLEEFKEATVVCVAHRLNSIKNFDRIVVFCQGQILAEGSFSGLLESCPYFALLYETGQDFTRSMSREEMVTVTSE